MNSRLAVECVLCR